LRFLSAQSAATPRDEDDQYKAAAGELPDTEECSDNNREQDHVAVGPRSGFRDLLGGLGACPATGLHVDYTADYIFCK
jgi:hypothetical protein